MKTQRIVVITLLGALVCGGVWQKSGSAEEAMTNSRTATGSTVRKSATKASSSDGATSNDAKILRKLDDVLANQETILKNQQTIFQRFDAVMDELRIVKIRASQSRGAVQ